MSLYGLAMCSHDDPDPWLACEWGISDHPHYHDCGNCNHAKYGSCEYGKAQLAIDECRQLIDRIDAILEPDCESDARNITFELYDACD